MLVGIGIAIGFLRKLAGLPANAVTYSGKPVTYSGTFITFGA
jgi:hypothetical protein